MSLFIPELRRISEREKISGHSAGGVFFYPDGPKLFDAYLAAMLCIEGGIALENLDILVTDQNLFGLKLGKRARFDLDWFIKENRPLEE